MTQTFEIVERVDKKRVDGEVSFNPRIAPNFMHNGISVDKHTFDNLITLGTQIFTNSNSI